MKLRSSLLLYNTISSRIGNSLPAIASSSSQAFRSYVSSEPKSSADKKLLVFYDGDCPMCKKEIAFYEKIKEKIPLSSVTLGPTPTFVNLHEADVLKKMNSNGITFDDAMKEIHILSAEGKVKRGADAFVEIWKGLPYWKHLATFTETVPGVLPVARVVYSAFAKRRATLAKLFE